jgi:hypothetical protein
MASVVEKRKKSKSVSLPAVTTTVAEVATPGIFQESTVEVEIHLAPLLLSSAQRGVDDRLNSFLLKYVDAVQGVVLSYSDPRLVHRGARIVQDNPFVHFRVRANVLAFAPSPGSLLGKRSHPPSPSVFLSCLWNDMLMRDGGDGNSGYDLEAEGGACLAGRLWSIHGIHPAGFHAPRRARLFRRV